MECYFCDATVPADARACERCGWIVASVGKSRSVPLSTESGAKSGQQRVEHGRVSTGHVNRPPHA